MTKKDNNNTKKNSLAFDIGAWLGLLSLAGHSCSVSPFSVEPSPALAAGPCSLPSNHLTGAVPGVLLCLLHPLQTYPQNLRLGLLGLSLSQITTSTAFTEQVKFPSCTRRECPVSEDDVLFLPKGLSQAPPPRAYTAFALRNIVS